jgi:hypothetical protein
MARLDLIEGYSFGSELVPKERWSWIAEYEDGSTLQQFDDAAMMFHQVREIDQGKLAVFRMVCEGLPEVRIFMEPGMRIVHHYVNTIMEHGTPREMRIRQYVAGFEKDTPNGTKAWLAIIGPDDSVTLTDKE